MTTPLVIFMFAGRRANMEVQRPMLDRLLDRHPEATLDLWNLTRTKADSDYLTGLMGAHGGRVRVLDHLHPGFPLNCLYPDGAIRPRGWRRCTCMAHQPPYEKPYQWYASRYEKSDTLYVKIDDDVLFLETERFNDLLFPLLSHPNRVISANVINNAVCAKYEMPDMFDGEYDPRQPKFDRFWWSLHTAAGFAEDSHRWFLSNYGTLSAGIRPSYYVRTRPGEAISINCIAFTQATMNRLARAFTHNPRLGDEGVVDSYLPWIAQTCYAAHLSFGPQEKGLGEDRLTEYRLRYAHLNQTYRSRLATGVVWE